MFAGTPPYPLTRAPTASGGHLRHSRTACSSLPLRAATKLCHLRRARLRRITQRRAACVLFARCSALTRSPLVAAPPYQANVVYKNARSGCSLTYRTGMCKTAIFERQTRKQTARGLCPTKSPAVMFAGTPRFAPQNHLHDVCGDPEICPTKSLA